MRLPVGSLVWQIAPYIPAIPQPWYPVGPQDPENINPTPNLGKGKEPPKKTLFSQLEEEEEQKAEWMQPTPDDVWWNGQILEGPTISFDLETNITYDNRIGDPVILSIGGRDTSGKIISYLVEPEKIVECFEAQLEARPNNTWVGYNICGFDHPLLDMRIPGFRERISEKYFWDMAFQKQPTGGKLVDIWVLIMLMDLANNPLGDFFKPRNKDGSVKAGAKNSPAVPEEWWLEGVGPYTLESQIYRFLKKRILKDERRTNYGQFLGKARSMPWGFAEYSLLDAHYPIELYETLIKSEIYKNVTAKVLEETRAINGVPNFGPLTHGIQYGAAYSLTTATNNGFCVDIEKAFELFESKKAEARGYLNTIVEAGFASMGETLQNDHIEVDRFFQHLREEIPNAPRDQKRESWLEFFGLRPKSWEQLEGLKDIPNPLVRAYFLYRYIAKEATDIKKYVPEKGKKLYPRFRAILATGRTACNNPNLQQVKRDQLFRSLFIADSGCRLIVIDYGQIEMATWAQVCYNRYGFSRLADIMNAGVDPHIYTGMYFVLPAREAEWLPLVLEGKGIPEIAEALGVDAKELKNGRQSAKPINFGLPGGMGAKTLQASALRDYGVKFSDEECYEAIERFKKLYPEYEAWMLESRKFSLGKPAYDSSGVPVWRDSFDGCVTLTGRKRAQIGHNIWHNTQFQGLAADGMKLTLLEATRRGLKIVNQVHDEIVIEALDDVAEDIATAMEDMMCYNMEKILPDVWVKADVARQGSKEPEPGLLPRYWKKG
jgi:hypothetical protein